MKKPEAGHFTRREVLGGAAALGATPLHSTDEKLAALGGAPVRKAGFPSWPVLGPNEERRWMDVLRGRRWFRFDGSHVRAFETEWAKRLGAKHALAVANGTSALVTSLNALEVGPGDEVLVPPYTFVATVNAVLLQHALPIFVDSDLETFQMDAGKVEAAINSRTACVIPVHLGGATADMDTILSAAGKRSVPVIEDACQAHGAEWRGRKVGTWGHLGCFSFQASKNLNSGEGGAVTTNKPELYVRAFAFHNQGNAPSGAQFAKPGIGCNLRMTEFQGALLLEQLTRLEVQSRTRERNATYLTTQLKEIPGIHPAKIVDGCTRNAYHLYMFRYDKAAFADVPRARFMEALRAEGIPCSGGYGPLNKGAFLKNILDSRGFKTIYPAGRLREYHERNLCPVNDQLCEQAVWFTQTMFLGEKRDMDQIAEAVRKIHKQAGSLRAA